MDVDNSGKSYYGETSLYLVSLDGSFDGMVDLGELDKPFHLYIALLTRPIDKEGPIYDFCWSPTSREFVVCYGCKQNKGVYMLEPDHYADMPSRTQLFDSKTKPTHSFGSQHRNVLLYQPQGRLLLSAGFGNLAGGVDIWDVSTRNKVAEFK